MEIHLYKPRNLFRQTEPPLGNEPRSGWTREARQVLMEQIVDATHPYKSGAEMVEYATPLAEKNAKVFISYSRRDAEFADSLHVELLKLGYDVFLDRTDIAPGENWKDRLEALILAADAVVYLITDASIASEICDWEIQRTLELGKRLVPLAHGPRTRSVPALLSKLNYVFSDAPALGVSQLPTPTETALSQLSAAFDTDISWVREHSRLASLARRWASEDGANRLSLLLRRGEVERSKSWMNLRPSANAPAISQELRDFVRASDEHEQFERERLLKITGRAFVVPAYQAMDEGRLEESLRISAAGVVLGDDTENLLVPERESAICISATLNSLRSTLHGHGKFVNEVFLSRNGKRVMADYSDHTVRVWEADTGAELAFLGDERSRMSPSGFSPDGTRLAVICYDREISDPSDPRIFERIVRIVETDTGAEVACIRHPTDSLDSAVFSPDGTRVVTVSNYMTIRVWDAATGSEIATLAAPKDSVFSAGFSSDGTRIVTTPPGSGNESVRVWDAVTGALVSVLRGDAGMTQSVEFSPDGTRLVTSGLKKTAVIWDCRKGSKLTVLRGHGDIVRSAAFSPDGTQVVTTSDDKTVRVWHATRGSELAVISVKPDGAGSVAFSPDGARVVTKAHDQLRVFEVSTGRELLALQLGTAGDEHETSACWTRSVSREDDVVRVWDATTRGNWATLRGHKGRINSAVFSPDGERILTASDDGTARVWDANTGVELTVMRGHRRGVTDATFNPDRKWVATNSYFEKSASTWDANTGENSTRLHAHSKQLHGAQLSPDGKRWATVLSDNTVNVWDTLSRKKLATLRGHSDEITKVEFSPDGTRLATTSFDTSARIWNATTGAELAVIGDQKWRTTGATFSPDGQKLIVTSKNQPRISVLDASTGAELAVFGGHEGEVTATAFSPDGTRVLTKSFESTRIWDSLTGAELAVLRGAEHEFSSSCFSPDGKLVVTIAGHTARVSDSATGAELTVLHGHDANVNSAAFSPDGHKILTASDDMTVRLWDVTRARIFLSNVAFGLAASLTSGRGRRSAPERTDLLMQLSADDLHLALMEKLVDGKSHREAIEIKSLVDDRARVLSEPNWPTQLLEPTWL